MIGLMRGGKFLAEQSPEDLLKKYSAVSLEDVFLKLSVLQNMGKRRRSSIAKEVIEAVQLPAITVNLSLFHPGQTFLINLFRSLHYRIQL